MMLALWCSTHQKNRREKQLSSYVSLKNHHLPNPVVCNSMQETFSLYWTASANQKKLEAIANITTLPKGTALSLHLVTRSPPEASPYEKIHAFFNRVIQFFNCPVFLKATNNYCNASLCKHILSWILIYNLHQQPVNQPLFTFLACFTHSPVWHNKNKS